MAVHVASLFETLGKISIGALVSLPIWQRKRELASFHHIEGFLTLNRSVKIFQYVLNGELYK